MSAQEEEYYESNLPRSVKIAAEQFEIEEDTSESGRRGGGAIGEVFRRSSHPGVSLFYIGFKLAAIAAYLLLGFLLHNFVIQFVTTVTLLAFDFWMTKNISGRLLVGLRWWTDVQDDGSTTWRFECIEDSSSVNGFDNRIFWWTMYLFPLVWVGLGLMCIIRFKFKWLLVVGIALILSVTNLFAYFKCSRQQLEQARSYVRSAVIDQAMSYFSGP